MSADGQSEFFSSFATKKRAGKGKVYNIHGEQQCFKQMP